MFILVFIAVHFGFYLRDWRVQYSTQKVITVAVVVFVCFLSVKLYLHNHYTCILSLFLSVQSPPPPPTHSLVKI